MLDSKHFQKGGCYTAAWIRKRVASCMLQNSYSIFKSSTIIRRLDEIQAGYLTRFTEDSKFRVDGTEDILSDVLETLDPPILDATRICICFENFVKAELILRGFVIHKFESKKVLLPAFQHLFTEQNLRPIKVSEVKLGEGIGKRRKFSSLQSLKDKTLPFSQLLGQPKYRSKIRLPKDVFLILERINNKRNTLHFLSLDSRVYNQGTIDELFLLKRFVNERLVTRINRLFSEFGFPEITHVEPIQ